VEKREKRKRTEHIETNKIDVEGTRLTIRAAPFPPLDAILLKQRGGSSKDVGGKKRRGRAGRGFFGGCN